MNPHTRVLVDTYSVENGNSLRVEGRYDHVSSTEIDIERTIEFQAKRSYVAADQFVTGFDLVSEEKYNPAQNFENVHLFGQTPTIQTRKYALNRSITSLNYKPVGCQNEYECLPKEQAVILPYLCEQRVEKNVNFIHTRNHDTTIIDDTGIGGYAPRYDPRVLGGYVITTWTNSEVIANAESVVKTGFIPDDLVEFKQQDAEDLIPMGFDAVTDRLTLPLLNLEVDASVFGGQAGVNKFQFTIPEHQFGDVAFDQYGRHRFSANTDYVFPPVTHRELFPIRLDNAYIGQQGQAPNAPLLTLNAVANNQQGQAQYAANGVHLWLPHPYFARGCDRNRDVHPVMTLIDWYGKQEYINGNTRGPITVSPTTYPQMAILPNPKSVIVGRNLQVEFKEDIDVTENGLTTTFLPFFRRIESYSMVIDSLELYEHIRDSAAGTQFTLVLDHVGDLPIANNNNFPLPNLGTQHLDTWATDSHYVDMVLVFNRNHAECDDADHSISFTRTFLASRGGANNWGLGRPYLCPANQLFGRGAPNTGLVTRTLKSNINPQDRTDANAPNVDLDDQKWDETQTLYRNGVRPLFFTALVSARRFMHEVKRTRVEIPNFAQRFNQGNNLSVLGALNNIAAPNDAQFTLFNDLDGQGQAAYNALNSNMKLRRFQFYREHLGRHAVSVQAGQIAYNTTEGNANAKQTAYDNVYVATYNATNPAYNQHHVPIFGDDIATQASAKLIQDDLENDRLYHTLKRSFSGGRIATRVPQFRDVDTVPIMLSNRLENSLVLREKLFGYKTLSSYRLDKRIFPQFGEWYPLQLQDYDLQFVFDNNLSQFLASGGYPDCAFVPVKTSNMTLYIRSKNSANQAEKSLLKADYYYPQIERFTSNTDHSTDARGVSSPATVQCITSHGFPDYIFAYVERIGFDDVYENSDVPKIGSLQVKNKQQPVNLYSDALSGGIMTKFDLVDCTRRNAAPLCNLTDLYKDTGGILLSRHDVGTLMQDQLNTKLIEWEFTFGITQELQDQDRDGGANDARFMTRIQRPTECTVLFIYKNGSWLEGELRKLVFHKMTLNNK